MYYVLPMFVVIAVYALAAVIPALFLMRYIYRRDTIEKEPPLLLIALIGMGVVAALAAIVLESIGQLILPIFIDEQTTTYTILLAFLVVAVAEEGTKFICLKLATWKNTNFNYRFDAIVYSVFVSLGFAAFENIRYIMGYGLSVAIPRAVLAIPGHMGFAVFMGIFYGRARLCANRGNKAGSILNQLYGYISAVLLHGFYDSCSMIGNTLSTILFIAFVVIMYVIVFFMIKHESETDHPIQ